MHTNKFRVFFRNQNGLPAALANPTTYSVSDSIVSFTPTPTPRSPHSLLPTHHIHTPTLPTPTFLTFTCTHVLWFLARLTRGGRTRHVYFILSLAFVIIIVLVSHLPSLGPRLFLFCWNKHTRRKFNLTTQDHMSWNPILMSYHWLSIRILID